MLNCNLKLNKATENALKSISNEYKLWVVCEDNGDCKIIVSTLVGNTWYTASSELCDGMVFEIAESIGECLRIIKENLEFLNVQIEKPNIAPTAELLTKSEFSEKIRMYLFERKYTLRKFGEMLGISESTLCDWRNGKRMPRNKAQYDKVMAFIKGEL